MLIWLLFVVLFIYAGISVISYINWRKKQARDMADKLDKIIELLNKHEQR